MGNTYYVYQEGVGQPQRRCIKQPKGVAHEDFEAMRDLPEEWLSWLQFTRDDAPTIEELESNDVARKLRLDRARAWDAQDQQLQAQERAKRGADVGGQAYAAATLTDP